jgi:hypothetical protein
MVFLFLNKQNEYIVNIYFYTVRLIVLLVGADKRVSNKNNSNFYIYLQLII